MDRYENREKAIRIFSTCPHSTGVPRDRYVDEVAEVARWSEQAGCTGILVYTENSMVDPWLVSQVILQSTARLVPLVATQPAYMHPYSVAKMVASLGSMYRRQLWLNMVAGGFKNDLDALGDETPHDQRYERIVEYAQIVRSLLESPRPVTFEGRYYRVRNLPMRPPLDAELAPGFLMSGSSPASLDAARAIGATPVKYPRPPEHYLASPPPEGLGCGLRIGIVARSTSQEAWRVAEERFPAERAGQIAHQLAMKVSDSHWHRQLSNDARLAAQSEAPQKSPYWMWPFENSRSFCPYLVGDYAEVAEQIALYMSAGYRLFILDIPPCREELDHIRWVFEDAQALARRAGVLA